jgi:hypothetical protein
MREDLGHSIFIWATLKELAPEVLGYQNPVIVVRYEVELRCGERIHVWRSNDGKEFFCHGLTFGGKLAPGGAISPFGGAPVEAILRGHYDRVPGDEDAEVGDILVWRGVPHSPEGTTPHSATLTAIGWTPGRSYLDGQVTLLQTKNGLLPEANLPLDDLFDSYGETYDIYRRRPSDA